MTYLKNLTLLAIFLTCGQLFSSDNETLQRCALAEKKSDSNAIASLFAAVKAGNVTEVQKILAEQPKINLNARDKYDYTLSQIAQQQAYNLRRTKKAKNYLAIAKLLSNAGARN